MLDQKYAGHFNNNDKAIQMNKPYSDHTSMLRGAKDSHWHLLIFFQAVNLQFCLLKFGQSLFHCKLVNFHDLYKH